MEATHIFNIQWNGECIIFIIPNSIVSDSTQRCWFRPHLLILGKSLSLNSNGELSHEAVHARSTICEKDPFYTLPESSHLTPFFLVPCLIIFSFILIRLPAITSF
ncbi:hypothetical protein SERLA73DRAFT_174892, partial [Serpula lacrymans var. lacrymans S7.3]